MGRVSKEVKAVHALAVTMWQRNSDGLHVVFRDIEARLFGMGQVLAQCKKDRAAADAFFLASLAGHLSRGEFVDVVHQDIFADAEGRN